MGKAEKEAYQEYLKTDTWKTIRAQRLAMDNDECVLCGGKAKHVHHRRYPKKWGTETVKDLVCLCGSCHDKHHNEKESISADKLVKRLEDEGFDVLPYIIDEIHKKDTKSNPNHLWHLDMAAKIGFNLANFIMEYFNLDGMKSEVQTTTQNLNHLHDRIRKLEGRQDEGLTQCQTAG